MNEHNDITRVDNWQYLRKYTQARIAIGRTGVSIHHRENLSFKMSHAHARDAVYTTLDKNLLLKELNHLQPAVYFLNSKVTDRHEYLQRPDLGRKLDEASVQLLSGEQEMNYDVSICIADGLSAKAVNLHAIELLVLLVPLLKQQGYRLAPVCIVEQGRVAISDETGALLHSSLSIILLGERPGLSSADSLGAYITYAPRPGNTDAQRNCVSNIKPYGLGYKEAAEKIFQLSKAAMKQKISGVHLKDNDWLT